MKLLIDMNLSPRWVEFLSAAGFEAAHWMDIGARTASDSEIMAFARSNDYVVVTNDLDFGSILAASQGKTPSVVQIRAVDLNPSAIGRQLVAALSQMSVELEAGALLTVDPDRLRVRVLPLQQNRS